MVRYTLRETDRGTYMADSDTRESFLTVYLLRRLEITTVLIKPVSKWKNSGNRYTWRVGYTGY